ncbi:MAG TPA: hypothetical protein VNE62_12870, partial [Actinomycetota bacterium]|nr:hypothetical protein [Actinomycetota bacterium]
MRRLALFIALALTWSVLPTAAQATFADCLGPDTHGPIMYDFTPGPNPDPLAPGTLIQITVDDRP